MKKLIGILLLLFTLSLAAGMALATSDPNDVAGSGDPPLFTRMPGYHVDDYDDKDFDSVEMYVGQNNQMAAAEGHCIRIHYRINDGVKRASEVQIKRNYANAIQKIGGKVMYEDYVYETLKIVKNGAEIWALIEVRDEGDWYRLTVVTKQEMQQDVVADAASLANSLKDAGKVALYGIYFDTGKAEIKPESQPALEQIAKLLKDDPKLRLYVVGHTDDTGAFDANLKLSLDRAAAVVKTLVSQFGIDSARLTPCGDGPTAPLASNETEEGRALNRRVELVKRLAAATPGTNGTVATFLPVNEPTAPKVSTAANPEKSALPVTSNGPIILIVTVANPGEYSGPSPARIQFSAAVFVNKYPLKINYRWERSDGAKSQPQTLEIAGPVQGVTTTWTLGAPGKRYQIWERLHILAPVDIAAEPGRAAVVCR